MNALQSFIRDSGCLPLAGVVPDMKAETEFYVKIQKVYKEKARADSVKFKGYLDEIVQRSDLALIDQDLIERFCEYCSFIKIQRSASLNAEYSSTIPSSIRTRIFKT
jgi:NEDD8-activating enzyme E1 regulatory subunit